MVLNVDWRPGFGSIFTWFCMDKNGRIGMMVNNGFGDLPRSLLQLDNVESRLDELNELVWGESEKFQHDFHHPEANYELVFYSKYNNRGLADRAQVEANLLQSFGRVPEGSDLSVSIKHGFYLYHAVEGGFQGEDFPVGYQGEVEMGDYFKFLAPTVSSSIDDLPAELRGVVCISDMVDFEVKNMLSNVEINDFFVRQYC